MTPVTAETRVEWSTRLAQALVQAGYETERQPGAAGGRGSRPPADAGHAPGQQRAGPSQRGGRSVGPAGPAAGRRPGGVHPGPEAAAAMPADVAREFGAVALRFDGSVLAVAFAEPRERRMSMRCPDGSGHRVNRCSPIRW